MILKIKSWQNITKIVFPSALFCWVAEGPISSVWFRSILYIDKKMIRRCLLQIMMQWDGLQFEITVVLFNLLRVSHCVYTVRGTLQSCLLHGTTSTSCQTTSFCRICVRAMRQKISIITIIWWYKRIPALHSVLLRRRWIYQIRACGYKKSEHVDWKPRKSAAAETKAR